MEDNPIDTDCNHSPRTCGASDLGGLHETTTALLQNWEHLAAGQRRRIDELESRLVGLVEQNMVLTEHNTQLHANSNRTGEEYAILQVRYNDLCDRYDALEDELLAKSPINAAHSEVAARIFLRLIDEGSLDGHDDEIDHFLVITGHRHLEDL
jgi:hypothetical protein